MNFKIAIEKNTVRLFQNEKAVQESGDKLLGNERVINQKCDECIDTWIFDSSWFGLIKGMRGNVEQ